MCLDERSENGLMSLNCVDFLKCPFHGVGWLFLNSGKHKPFFMGNTNKNKQWRLTNDIEDYYRYFKVKIR
jgi:hypothetical protein